MRKTSLINAGLLVLVGAVAVASVNESPHPAKLSRGDIAGEVFDRAEIIELTTNGNTTLDVTSFLSSDKKFGTGMYRSGAVRFEITEPYGVDEFMYFLEGSVTLTSSDGVVQVINAGEAVTIAKEWTGVWDTKGYTKIWVIYSEDGSGLE
ncbi:MAG: cupin domain-containing protein [Woeseiaceae bacterium]